MAAKAEAQKVQRRVFNLIRVGPSRKEMRERERQELREISTELSKHAPGDGKPREIDVKAMVDTTIELQKLARQLHLVPAVDSIARKVGDAEDRAARLTLDVGEQHRTIQALLDLGVYKRRRDGAKEVLGVSRHQYRALEKVHNRLDEYREHLDQGKREQRVGVLAYAGKVIERLAKLVTPARRKKLRLG